MNKIIFMKQISLLLASSTNVSGSFVCESFKRIIPQ
jgi:hypothetical protein